VHWRDAAQAYPEGGHEAKEVDPEKGGRHVVVTVQRGRKGVRVNPIYLSVYINLSIYIYLSMSIYVSIYIYIYIGISSCMYTHTHTHTYIDMYIRRIQKEGMKPKR